MASGNLGLRFARYPLILIVIVVQFALVWWFAYAAYEIRMYPIHDFGYTIHEFDPWFNYRAAEYLASNNLSTFFKWYDYMSWYPLGRPIGTTIFPGMQITAVVIWEAMKSIGQVSIAVPSLVSTFATFLAGILRSQGALFIPPVPEGELTFMPMTVNEICCMIPPWFGTLASIFTGLLTYEISRSVNAGVVAVGIMAIIPAHLMRSVGGKFDNEAVAMTAICCTFWLWLRSVRTPKSWLFGVFAGLSYINMVAAWGGYIFVLNMIGVHALMLVGLGRFNSGVHKAYTLFYIIGTSGAIQIPVVGWQPLRSLEQLGPLGVFVGYQILAFCDGVRRRQSMTWKEFAMFRVKAMVALAAALVIVIIILSPMGYFGPLSSRIRGLFVKHTKTGNPLVDSVAEHQPASAGIYQSYLNLPLDYALFGGLVSFWKRNNGFYFLLLYAWIASHFSGKMSRLILICGPITAVACAIWCGFLLDFLLEPFLVLLGKQPCTPPVTLAAKEAVLTNGDAASKGKKGDAQPKKGKPKEIARPSKKKDRKSSWQPELREFEEEDRPGGMMQMKRIWKMKLSEGVPDETWEQIDEARYLWDNSSKVVMGRAALSILLVFVVLPLSGIKQKVGDFMSHADRVARSMSNAKVKYKVADKSGKPLVIDDYWQGYQWIDANTPTDARVMAWWDYGYQITGIAKRTSIADGNTWNHEHIATLGRILTSPQKKAHNSIRHLADYVLVWAGGRGDDLAKSPHLARIGNSVFPDHCGDDDPRCTKFGFYDQDHSKPTPMMKKSLLYNLVAWQVEPGAKVDTDLFEPVHDTKYGLMRLYKVLNVSQESKDWVADPKNRVCDAPGSWYCVGQYPPALDKLISMRRSFSQVEDFNKKGEKSAYTKLIEQERAGKKEL